MMMISHRNSFVDNDYKLHKQKLQLFLFSLQSVTPYFGLFSRVFSVSAGMGVRASHRPRESIIFLFY